MGKKDYEDLDDLLNDLSDEISTSMLVGEINNAVKEVYSNNVEKMYDAYEPKSYIRRGYWNGGFGDDANWQSSVSVLVDSLELELTNEAKPVYDTQYGLDEIIEEGIYDYGNVPKRPVYEWTQAEIDNSNIIEKALEKDLKDWL